MATRLRGVLKEVKGDATVLEVSSCSQAMQLIAENTNLNLILLDLNLPDRDGFSFLTESGERYPAISVVVMLAQRGRSSVVRALDLGALENYRPISEPNALPTHPLGRYH
jgi:DNA-binding NarL/FixJ family response regulator